MATKYLLAELDDRCRQYLKEVRESGGLDKPGVFLAGGGPHATWAFPLVGIVFLAIVLYFVIPPLTDPTAQAMLLTAGLLLGGWCVLAGFRVAVAFARGHNLGSFVYADPKQLWTVNNSVVERWPIKPLESVSVDGQNLSLEYPDRVVKVNIPYEIGIQEIAAYLAYWVTVRGEGEHDQGLIEAHAASARAAAYDQTPDEQPAFDLDIPVPKIDENARRAHDWPILLGIVVFGIALFFVVRVLVLIWHDHAVFDFVRGKGPAHWRVYLLDERNTRYRAEVQKMLRDRYEEKAAQLKRQILAHNEADFKGSDEAMEKLVLALLDAPQPIVTLRVQDTTDNIVRQQLLPMVPAPLYSRAQYELTDSLYTAIGQEMISLAQPMEDVPPLIDIQFKFAAEGKEHRLEWTLAIRKHPDSEPHYKTAWTTKFQHPHEAEQTFAKNLTRVKNALAGGAQ